MKRIIAAGAALGTLVALAPGAGAQAIATGDPNDSRGRFDVKEIRRAPGDGGESMVYVIRFYERWGCAAIDRKRRVMWRFDDRGSRKADWFGRFRCRDGNLTFEMRSADGEQQLEPLPANKNGKEVSTTIPGGFFRDDAPRAWATSVEHAGNCDPCKDRAPNRGAL